MSPPPMDGQLCFDQVARGAAAEDFGHIVHKAPDAVLIPGSDTDVAAAIKWVSDRGRTLAPQGQSHSVFGRSEAQDGVVAAMSALHAVGPVKGDRITVEAGATWSEVLATTLAAGKTPPVLTSYLELSVAGTIVVGGVGDTTSTHGVVADNVIEMDVVTGSGDKITCSANSNPELFDAVRAGLGQVGVITKATITLIAAPESVRRCQLFYPGLTTMLRDQRLLMSDNRFDAVTGAVLVAPTGGFVFRIECSKFFTGSPPEDDALLAGLSDEPAKRQVSTLAYFDYLNRLAAFEQALRGNGQWFFPHPWLNTFIGDSTVESVVSAELAALDPGNDLGPLGQVLINPMKRDAISSPLLQLPSENLIYAFNFVRVPATDDPANAHRLVEANTATYGRVTASGGVLYPVSALPLSRGEWHHHFGSAFDQLSAAKEKFDPKKVLTPGYEIF
jgi:cytokinin dehydrogenase